MAHQQAVAGAGGVEVVRRVIVDQPVVGGVVDALERERRAQLVALGGVVVDHVEDDLDAGRVQGLDHRLELGHLLPAAAGGGVGVVRGEEADGVVAPVVRQAALDQVRVLDELVHRHELDRGDPEPFEIVDDGRVADGGVGAADLLRHARVRLGEALDVRLVDDGVVVGQIRGAVVAPVEGRVGHHGQHRVAEAVHGVVRLVVVVEAVAEQGLVAVDLAVDRLGVRVKQQLGRIAPVPLIGLVGPVDPEAVALAGTDSRQVAVPHEAVHLGQVDALLRRRPPRSAPARPAALPPRTARSWCRNRRRWLPADTTGQA